MDVVLERLEAEEPHRIARVNGQRYAMQRVQCRHAPPRFARILDVVMHQQRIVQQLNRYGRSERIRRPCTRDARHGDAQAGAQHLAAAPRIVGEQLVKIRGLFVRQVGLHGVSVQFAVFGQHVAYQRLVLAGDVPCLRELHRRSELDLDQPDLRVVVQADGGFPQASRRITWGIGLRVPRPPSSVSRTASIGSCSTLSAL